MAVKKEHKIYLDYAAGTPVDPRVLRAMEPYFSTAFGNPGSLHRFGQEAIAVLDRSRETIAKSIGAGFREVIFTSSATEANNLALRGVVGSFLRGAGHQKMRPRIVLSSIEHDSVFETVRDLERDGIDVVVVPVNRNGVIDLKKLEAALNEQTILVSVMYANNEIGTIEPIPEIAKIIKNFRDQSANGERQGKNGDQGKIFEPFALGHLPMLHVDAVQAFQFLDCNADFLGVDMMTISSHKIYGPKGAGVLYVGANSKWHMAKSKGQRARSKEQGVNSKKRERGEAKRIADRGLQIMPIITGGGQEYGLRSGTENVPAIVGFGKAVEILEDERKRHAQRIAELVELLWSGIKKIHPDAEVNGAWQRAKSEEQMADGKGQMAKGKWQRAENLPNILNVYFPGREAQELITHLDLHGVMVSSGSACSARNITPSRVIQELGYSLERARQGIRFSLGRGTKKEDITQTIDILKKII